MSTPQQQSPPSFFRRLFRLRSHPAIPILTKDGLLPTTPTPERIIHRKAAPDLGQEPQLSPKRAEENLVPTEEVEEERRGRNREKRPLGALSKRSSAHPIPIPKAPSFTALSTALDASLASLHFHPRSIAANPLHSIHHIPALHLQHPAKSASPPHPIICTSVKTDGLPSILPRSLHSSPSCSSLSHRSPSNSSSISSTSSSLVSAASQDDHVDSPSGITTEEPDAYGGSSRGRSRREKALIHPTRSSSAGSQGVLSFGKRQHQHGLSAGFFPPSKSTTPNFSPPAPNSLTLSFVRPFARPPTSKVTTPTATRHLTTRSFPIVHVHDEDLADDDQEEDEAPRGRAMTRGRNLS